MKKTEEKAWFLAAIILLLVTLAAVVSLKVIEISILERDKFTKDCYYSNQDVFDKLSEDFKNLYGEGLTSAKFDGKTGRLSLRYEDDTVTHSTNTDFKAVLENLNERYGKFTHIDTSYDEGGNMLMYMLTKADKTKGDGINEPDLRLQFLMYADKKYSGKFSLQGAETFLEYEKPFSGKWYAYSKSGYSG